MFRKTVFWLHLSAGVSAGVFILIMAATGVMLSFERQIVEFANRNIEYVSVPQDPHLRSLRLLATVRFGHTGEYGGLPGQVIGALASLGACMLVYTGLSLTIRRLRARLQRKGPRSVVSREPHKKQPAVSVIH